MRIINPTGTLAAVCVFTFGCVLSLQAQPRPLKISLADTPVALSAIGGNGDWNLAVANLGSVTVLRVGSEGVRF